MKENIITKAKLYKQPYQTILVTDDPSLRLLLSTSSRIWHRGKILLHLEGFSPSETEHWQRNLNRQYSACGCTSGTIVMATTIELYMLILVLNLENLSRISWTHLVIGGLFGLLGAFVGKILGLVWARYQLKKLIEQLTLRMADCEAQLNSFSQ